MTEPYALQYSTGGRASMRELPEPVASVLFRVLDELAANPDAYPDRVRAVSRDGKTRLYDHPSPPLQITFEVDPSRRVLYLLHFGAPKVSVTKPVFISYSHNDAEWLEKLKKFLRPLEKQNLIRVWDDTEIRPGEQWLAQIGKALQSAHVAVFLVTQDFIDSAFIQSEELPVLIEAAANRGCVIFWIAVRPSTVADSPLARFQAANSPDKPLAAMSDVEQDRVLLEIYNKMKAAVSLQ